MSRTGGSRRRTFPDQAAQLALPIGGAATHSADVPRAPLSRLIVLPTSHHVDVALRANRAPLVPAVGAAGEGERPPVHTTLSQLEAGLARALLPGLRLARPEVVRLVVKHVLETSARARALASDAGLDATQLAGPVDRTIGQLHGSDVDASRLAEIAQHADPATARRAALLGEVFHEVTRALDALGLVDARSVPSRIAQALRSGTSRGTSLDRALFAAREIELRDTVRLTPARLAWIEALHARVGGITLVGPTAHAPLFASCGLDDPRERLAAQVEARWLALPDAPALAHRTPDRGTGTVFERLASRLFAEGSGPPLEVGDDMALVSASTLAVQADVAACEVAAALRRGLAPESIVVALPTIDEIVVRPLRRALRRLGIPFHEPRGESPLSSPVVATLLSLLHAIDRGIHKSELVDLLRSAHGLAPRRARMELVRALERIPGSDLRREGDAIVAAMPELLRDTTRSLVDAFTPAASPSRASALAHVDRLVSLLDVAADVQRGTGALIRRDDAQLLDALAAQNAAWAAFVAAVDDVARATELVSAELAPVSFGALAREIEEALEGRHHVAGHRPGAISIARLRDRIGLPCEVLVLLEAHDGALPARGVADPLLSRPLVQALRSLDPARAPPPDSMAGLMDLLAAVDAIGHTRSRLVVIHRTTDDAGRTQLPGALPLEIARVSSARPRVERAWAIPGASIARRPDELVLHAHRHMRGLVLSRAHGEGDSESELARDVPPHLDADAFVRARVERIRAQAFARAEAGIVPIGPYTGRAGPLDEIARARLLARLGREDAHPLSVSAAETLMSCPFVVFAQHVLRASHDDPIEDDGGARGAGDRAHQALLEIHRALIASPTADDAERLALARSTALHVIDPEGALTAVQRVRRERLVDEVMQLVVLDHDAASTDGRRFVDGEVAFGRDGAWPVLRLGTGDEAVALAGRIDRIDVGTGGVATLIDYKGKAPVGMGSAVFFEDVRPGSIQIVLYAHAAAHALVPVPSRVVARFLGYRERKWLGAVGTKQSGDDDVWRTWAGAPAGGTGQGRAVEQLLVAVAAARAGELPPRRGPKCGKCAQRAACRAPVVVLDAEGEHHA